MFISLIDHHYASLLNKSFITLYPNLFYNKTQKTIQILGLTKKAIVEIFNNLGAKILEKECTNCDLKVNFQTGLYFAKITSENKTVVKKMLVE